MCHLKFDPDYQDYLGLSECSVLHLQQPRNMELISFFAAFFRVEDRFEMTFYWPRLSFREIQ